LGRLEKIRSLTSPTHEGEKLGLLDSFYRPTSPTDGREKLSLSHLPPIQNRQSKIQNSFTPISEAKQGRAWNAHPPRFGWNHYPVWMPAWCRLDARL